MNDRTLIKTGGIDAAVAAVCCATPILAIGLAAAGLTAWLATADYVLIPALLISLGPVAFGLYRRRNAAACRAPAAGKEEIKS
ncbi:MAG: mercury resistance system transport protein MerF [Hyphomicrobiales bacterium]